VAETDSIVPVRPYPVRLIGKYTRGKLTPGSVLITDKPGNALNAIADELVNLSPILYDNAKTRKETCIIEFEADTCVQMLIGYYRDDQQKFAQAPKLETDASANDYGQAEPVLEGAVHLKGMPLVNVHSYHFPAGHHSFILPKGLSLVLGFTTDEIKPRNVGLAGNADTMEWLFN